jgi:hypothetical protein
MNTHILKLSLFVSIISLIACKKETRLRGSGNIVSENRVVDYFDGVNSSGSATVNIRYGTIQKVEVKADDNIIRHVHTRIDNSILSLDMEDGYRYRDVSLTLNITIPRLTYIKNSGSGRFYASNFTGLSSLSVKNSGSGQIELDGSGNDLTIKNSGSGEVYAFNFRAKNAHITNSGSGTFEVYCTDNLRGKNSGSGTIYYKGNPSISFTNSGSGSIIDAN